MSATPSPTSSASNLNSPTRNATVAEAANDRRCCPTPKRSVERFAELMTDRPEKLQKHVKRVERGALRLAAIHELDRDICAAAAAGHDLFRHCKDAGANRAVTPLSRSRSAKTNWQPQSCSTVRSLPPTRGKTMNVEHEDILAAIAYHTTAHPGYSFEASGRLPRRQDRSAQGPDVIPASPPSPQRPSKTSTPPPRCSSNAA